MRNKSNNLLIACVCSQAHKSINASDVFPIYFHGKTKQEIDFSAHADIYQYYKRTIDLSAHPPIITGNRNKNNNENECDFCMLPLHLACLLRLLPKCSCTQVSEFRGIDQRCCEQCYAALYLPQCASKPWCWFLYTAPRIKELLPGRKENANAIWLHA